MNFNLGLKNLRILLASNVRIEDNDFYLDFEGWKSRYVEIEDNEHRFLTLDNNEKTEQRKIRRKFDELSLKFTSSSLSFLDLCGIDTSTFIATVIINNWYLDKQTLERLQQAYLVPQPSANFTATTPSNYGPDIDWQGTLKPEELQIFESPLLDVGQLQQALECAKAVCLITFSKKSKRCGTGFLVAPNIILTNFHVMKTIESDDLEETTRLAQFHFGFYSFEQHPTQNFILDKRQPVLDFSPTKELDYVLLRVEDTIFRARELKPVLLETKVLPSKDDSLHILQHPTGEPMKLAINEQGVAWVNPSKGLVQYVTRTNSGSSGAPCFNVDWKVVALHHAERSKPSGSIREGILLSKIYPRIKKYLN